MKIPAHLLLTAATAAAALLGALLATSLAHAGTPHDTGRTRGHIGAGNPSNQPGLADLRGHREQRDGRCGSHHQGARRPRSAGVHISIDDFGTGHSSLSYLRMLAADELKIDRSFVQDLETSEDARKVALAVVNLAKALNLKVVAEGVKTEGQNKILRDMGCDQLQGYLFAKPMSATALALWAMEDEGPRAMNFRASIFKETGYREPAYRR